LVRPVHGLTTEFRITPERAIMNRSAARHAGDPHERELEGPGGDRGALAGLMERINNLGLDVIDVSLVAEPER
jgi:hypothetical protein